MKVFKKLLPCPKCGSSHVTVVPALDKRHYCRVTCEVCECELVADTNKLAVKTWNKELR